MSDPMQQLLVLVGGYVVSLGLGAILIQPVVGWYWRKYFPDKRHLAVLSISIGVIERFMYTSAYLLGAREFIAVWLALKLAWQWTPNQKEEDRTMFYVLLIGNALSVIVGVGSALLIQLLWSL